MCAFGNSYRSIRVRGGVQNKPWYTTFKPFLVLVADTQTSWTHFTAKVSRSEERVRGSEHVLNEVQQLWTFSGMRGEGELLVNTLNY